MNPAHRFRMEYLKVYGILSFLNFRLEIPSNDIPLMIFSIKI